MQPRRTDLVPAVCGIAALVLYAATAVHGVGWDDSAELSAGIDRLGLVHQTGYPLYLLAGRAFELVEPFGSAATRTSLFSAVLQAVVVWLAALFLRRRTGSDLAAVVGALLLATGSVFWSQARVASVYPAFLLAIMLVLVAVDAWDRRPTARRLWLCAAACGLLCVSHRTGVFFTAAVVVFLWGRRERLAEATLREALLAVVAFLAPLATLAYLPLRQHYSGFPNVLAGTDDTLLGLMTGTLKAPDAKVLGVGAVDVARNVLHLGMLGVAQLSLAAVVLIPAGLWAVRRDRLLLTCGVAPAVVASAIAVTTFGTYAYWHLPLLLIGALVCGAGVLPIRDWLRARGGSVRAGAAAAALACAGLTGAVLGVRYVHHEQLDASPWARRTLAALPPSATVTAPWTAFTVLRATQVLEDRRRDVHVIEFNGGDETPIRAPRFVVTSVQNDPPEHRGPLRPLAPAAPTNLKGASGLSLLGHRYGTLDDRAQLTETAGA